MKKLFILIVLLIAYSLLPAQNFRIPLWEKEVPNYQATDEVEVRDSSNILRVRLVQNPEIEVYLPAKKNANGQAVIICPGGGYHILAYDWEGTDIAKWLNAQGVAAIVLKYRLPVSKSNIEPHKSPLMDAQRAMRLVRRYATSWNIDYQKIGIMGFSAGGHLASTLGTHFDKGEADASDPVDRLSSRPDFMILVYPVISFTESFAHKGSRTALLGENPSEALVRYYSNELQIKANTPPTFLIHAADDKGVPVENSLVFYQKLREKGIPAELHVYPEGGHGFSLAFGKGHLQTWPQRLKDWMEWLENQ